jgi:hypothetical protein
MITNELNSLLSQKIGKVTSVRAKMSLEVGRPFENDVKALVSRRMTQVPLSEYTCSITSGLQYFGPGHDIQTQGGCTWDVKETTVHSFPSGPGSDIEDLVAWRVLTR